MLTLNYAFKRWSEGAVCPSEGLPTPSGNAQGLSNGDGVKKVRLTNKIAYRAKFLVEGGQRFIRDSKVEGFALRITAGSKTWTWEGRIKKRGVGGRNQFIRTTLGQYPEMKEPEARDKAEDTRAAVARGEDPRESRNPHLKEATFGQLADAYIERVRTENAASSVRADEYMLKHYIPSSWRERNLSAITADDIDKLKKSIGETCPPRPRKKQVKRDRKPAHPKATRHSAANHTLRLLRAMFNRAILNRNKGGLEMFKGDNPVAGFKMYKDNKRKVYLTPDELKRVNEALLKEDSVWQAYFPLCAMLGLRRSELLSLRWENVKLEEEQPTLKLPTTKNDEEHVLPLPPQAVAILSKLERKSEWVFPSIGKTGHIVEPKSAWQRIRTAAGVPQVRIHDLRHTLASWMVAAGYSLPVIGRALNHKSLEASQRYAHADRSILSEALNTVAALMSPTPVA